MVLLGSSCKSIRKRWQNALTGAFPTHEVLDSIGLREALTRYKPAVLLLDSDIIRHRGIRQLLTLVDANPDTRIIYFTDRLSDAEAIAVLKAGARGYCAKKISGALLKKAVHAVKNEEFWIGRRLIAPLINSLRTTGRGRGEIFMKHNKSASSPPLTVLSPRELDIASMIGTGEHNKIISSYLSISEKTVKAHLTNIFKKLGISSRTQLALFVRHHRSIPKFSIKQAHPHLNGNGIENVGGI
jgi:two-component system NarL family response regulator